LGRVLPEAFRLRQDSGRVGRRVGQGGPLCPRRTRLSGCGDL